MQEIQVNILGQKRIFNCELRNADQSLYEIVDKEGEAAIQSISLEINNSIQILIFSGLKVVGDKVFSFEPIGGESHFLGHLLS